MNNNLAEKYLEILVNHREFIENKYLSGDKYFSNLSGIFLPSVHEQFVHAKNKVMIIGRETKEWNIQVDDKFTSLEDYISKAMDIHNKYFLKQLAKKNSVGCSFHNFLRNVSKKSGPCGVIWANLFCFSYRKSLPTKSKYFDEIKTISQKLLKKQIETLEPNILIFVNGISTVPCRRDFFPLVECKNGKNFSMFDKRVTNHYLWQFDWNGIRSFRLHHPSAFTEDAIYARQYFLEKVLPENLS